MLVEADIVLFREIEYAVRETVQPHTNKLFVCIPAAMTDIVERAMAVRMVGEATSWGSMGNIKNFPITVKYSVLEAVC